MDHPRTLKSVLLELAKDRDKLAKYLESPKAVLGASGLPAEVIAAVLSRDQKKLLLFIGTILAVPRVNIEMKRRTPKRLKQHARSARRPRKSTRRKR